MIYKNILLAVNIYEDADLVIKPAIEFAKKNKANQIKIITVIDCVGPFAPYIVESQHLLEKEAKKTLEKLVSGVADIDIQCEVLIGSPSIEIVSYAKQEKIDLIVIGSHGTSGINLLLGCVANTVLHKASCDVLTIRIGDDVPVNDNYQRLLVPTDLESDSCMIVEKAHELASIYNTQVDTVFVIPNDSSSLITYEVEKVEATLDDFVTKNNINGNKKVLVGNVAESIVNQAKENGNDLIIVGSHRRNAVGRFFLGSTANSILHQAKTDILVVRLK